MAASASPSTLSPLERSALQQRASRGEARKPSPTPSASPSPSPSRSDADDNGGSSGGHTGQSGSCQASFYSDGQRTANGEEFDPNALTAANKELPFNTRVKVTNRRNGKSVVVRINDRGPYVSGRCLDLSRAAFQQIESTGAGTASVDYVVVN